MALRFYHGGTEGTKYHGVSSVSLSELCVSVVDLSICHSTSLNFVFDLFLLLFSNQVLIDQAIHFS